MHLFQTVWASDYWKLENSTRGWQLINARNLPSKNMMPTHRWLRRDDNLLMLVYLPSKCKWYNFKQLWLGRRLNRENWNIENNVDCLHTIEWC